MPAKRKAYLDEAVKLYESGMSLADIAEFYGVSRQSIWQALTSRGTKMRPMRKVAEDNHFTRGGSLMDKRAQHIVEKAVKKGILVRPESCSACGESKRFSDGRSGIQAHHDDYNKPLDVRWLCQPCHHEWHKTHTSIERSTEKCGATEKPARVATCEVCGAVFEQDVERDKRTCSRACATRLSWASRKP